MTSLRTRAVQIPNRDDIVKIRCHARVIAIGRHQRLRSVVHVGSNPIPGTVKHCKFCAAEYERGQCLAGHQTWCHANPNRRSSAAKIAAKQRGIALDEHRRTSISNSIYAKIAEGSWHNSFAKRKQYTYCGASFDGTWELKFAQWCDANKVQWIRNKRSFTYIFDQKRHYTPDFYLPVVDCYIEIKGWAVEKDYAKWSQFPERLLILRGEDLQALGLHVEIKQQHIHSSRGGDASC